MSKTVTLLGLLLFLALFLSCLGVLAPPVTAETTRTHTNSAGYAFERKAQKPLITFFSSLHYTFSSLCVHRDRREGLGVERGGGREAGGGETPVIGK